MPVVGGGHGDAGVDASHLRGHDAGGTVPPGDRAPHQQHVTAQLPPAPVEDLGPQDQLGVPGLILDSDEHRTVLPPGVLPGYGPACHHDLLSL